jgi:hypothetical protein
MTPSTGSTLLLTLAELEPPIRILWGIIIVLFVGLLVIAALPTPTRVKKVESKNQRDSRRAAVHSPDPSSDDVRAAVAWLSRVPDSQLAGVVKDMVAVAPFLERRMAACEALQAADWDHAVHLLEGLISEGDSSSGNYRILGFCHEKRGSGLDAENTYAEGLVKNPGSAELHFALGRHLFASVARAPSSDALDLIRRSRDVLQRAADLDSRNAHALELLGATQGTLGEFEAALDSLAKLTQVDEARAARLRSVIDGQRELRDRGGVHRGTAE